MCIFVFVGDNVIVLGVVALIGIGSIIGACAFCFGRKRKFEVRHTHTLIITAI